MFDLILTALVVRQLTHRHIVEWTVEHFRKKLLDELSNFVTLIARNIRGETLSV